jgi:hypothetical protein
MKFIILELQSFPREYEDKDMAAMLDDVTKWANEKYFVNDHQHGDYDITCNWSIQTNIVEITDNITNNIKYVYLHWVESWRVSFW